MVQEASQPSGNTMNLISIGFLTPEGKVLTAAEIFLRDSGKFLRYLNRENLQSNKETFDFKILFAKKKKKISFAILNCANRWRSCSI